MGNKVIVGGRRSNMLGAGMEVYVQEEREGGNVWVQG